MHLGNFGSQQEDSDEEATFFSRSHDALVCGTGRDILVADSKCGNGLCRCENGEHE